MGDTPDNRWQFWIDRGGTFTDVVARAPDGAITTAKLLSENPGRYADAALEGIRRILDLPAGAPLGGIGAVRMGTTVGTNALLQRQGAPTALVITKGFGDALTIGTQNRPDLFALEIKLPPVLYSQVIEVAERVSAAGEVLLGLDEQAARKDLAAARAAGIGAVAIVLMHGYRYPAHEHRLTAIAREAGFEHVSTSSAVSPLMKLVARGDTTVVDAYLSPLLRGYVRAVSHGLGDGPVLQFMQSNGGLTAAVAFRGKDSILSGPAGGVVGAVHASLSAGFERMVGFDMGGTSTDVCHYAGAFERTYRSEVAGVRLQAPMMDIQTVAAGGGSILRFDGARLRVGPQSAGADPGPACYRRGGAAYSHRRQRPAGPHPAGALSQSIRARRRSAPGPRGGGAGLRRPCRATRSRIWCRHPAAGTGRGVRRHRRRQHGQRRQEDLGAARPRCHRPRAVLFRWRRRPARLRRRRRPGHDPGADPRPCGGVVGHRHRLGGGHRHFRANHGNRAARRRHG